MISKKTMKESLPTALQVGILSVLFAVMYVQSIGIAPESLMVNQARLNVATCFALRFLLPVILVHLLPLGVPDTTVIRIGVAFIAVTACFLLLKPYAMRITREARYKQLNTVFFLILLLHYTGFKVLNIYYVYDIPAIAFYMGAFVLLTSESKRNVWLGVLVAILLSMNRETIIFAALHAIGYNLARSDRILRKKTLMILIPSLTAFVGILLLHVELLHLIGIRDIFQFSDHEGTDYRFIAYLKKLLTQQQARFQLFTFGAGIIVWLPLIFTRLTRIEKWLVALSLPGLIMLNYAGNLIELRMYNECVPLITLLFMHFQTIDTLQDRKRISHTA